MLRTRLITAFWLIPLILGSVYVGGLAFFIVVVVALLIAGNEFFQMAQHAGYHPHPPVGLTLIVLFLGNVYLETTMSHADSSQTIIAAGLVFSLVAAMFKRSEGWLVGWALTLAGALYVGGLGGYFILLRALPDGMIWSTVAILTAWAADTGAYVAGTNFGRHKFFPEISPKKTWEGAIGGWIAATLVALAFGALLGLLNPIANLIFGFGIGIAATFGDLAESLLKRQMGSKDSGTIMPGHGGMLDRLDSLLFTAVFAYYYLFWILK